LAEKDWEATPLDANRAATALLVDDDVVSRLTTRQRLEGEGYAVVMAQDETEGLSRAKQSSPNVIYIHLVAGSRGSIPFMQALRSDDSCRHIPIVVIKEGLTVEAALKQKKLRSVHRDRW
jgi:CheY-like chemotaxis protein